MFVCACVCVYTIQWRRIRIACVPCPRGRVCVYALIYTYIQYIYRDVSEPAASLSSVIMKSIGFESAGFIPCALC